MQVNHWRLGFRAVTVWKVRSLYTPDPSPAEAGFRMTPGIGRAGFGSDRKERAQECMGGNRGASTASKRSRATALTSLSMTNGEWVFAAGLKCALPEKGRDALTTGAVSSLLRGDGFQGAESFHRAVDDRLQFAGVLGLAAFRQDLPGFIRAKPPGIASHF